ncbi:MAG TPA: hypothetical protein VNU68_13240 [Verrucomicrobiae bacterium]|nr:hypothetical protein [Verrucomicrobiae bacterium]
MNLPLVIAGVASFSSVLLSDAAVTGQWDFDSGDLRATIGVPLRYMDGNEGATAKGTVFNSTAMFGLPPIGGQVAKVMHFPQMTLATMGYVVTHGVEPNGEGEQVNQYTILMDVLFPASSSGAFRSLLQTDNKGDADLYISFLEGRGSIGSLGDYRGEGELIAEHWHRVAVAVDVSALTMSKYIDGMLFGTQTLSATELDGRYSLGPTAMLFADEDGDSQPVYLNSVQIRNYTMDESKIAALGGPEARGIPVR